MQIKITDFFAKLLLEYCFQKLYCENLIPRPHFRKKATKVHFLSEINNPILYNNNNNNNPILRSSSLDCINNDSIFNIYSSENQICFQTIYFVFNAQLE